MKHYRPTLQLQRNWAAAVNTPLVPTIRGRPFFVTPNEAAERILKEKFNG